MKKLMDKITAAGETGAPTPNVPLATEPLAPAYVHGAPATEGTTERAVQIDASSGQRASLVEDTMSVADSTEEQADVQWAGGTPVGLVKIDDLPRHFSFGLRHASNGRSSVARENRPVVADHNGASDVNTPSAGGRPEIPGHEEPVIAHHPDNAVRQEPVEVQTATAPDVGLSEAAVAPQQPSKGNTMRGLSSKQKSILAGAAVAMIIGAVFLWQERTGKQVDRKMKRLPAPVVASAMQRAMSSANRPFPAALAVQGRATSAQALVKLSPFVQALDIKMKKTTPDVVAAPQAQPAKVSPAGADPVVAAKPITAQTVPVQPVVTAKPVAVAKVIDKKENGGQEKPPMRRHLKSHSAIGAVIPKNRRRAVSEGRARAQTTYAKNIGASNVDYKVEPKTVEMPLVSQNANSDNQASSDLLKQLEAARKLH